jgi:RNA polymerase sigma-70 factor (ECF subfamily)
VSDGKSAASNRAPDPRRDVDADLAAIIERIAAGERAALKQLYDDFGPRLLGIAHRILRDGALAEDALQEAFVKIWRNAARFDRARGSALGWTVIIVRRAAFDLRPRAPAFAPVDIVCEQPESDMLHPGLARALEALPERHREALLLMYIHGLTHSELAAAMGAPLGTVKSWVRRGAAALKDAVGEP